MLYIQFYTLLHIGHAWNAETREVIQFFIAMMGNTYQKMSETKGEYTKQWARIVLVLERCISPQERARAIQSYSHEMEGGTRGLILYRNFSEEECQEYKKLEFLKKKHISMLWHRSIKRRMLMEKTVTKD